MFAYSFDPYLLLGDAHTGQTSIEIPLEPGNDQLANEWLNPWDPLFLTSIVNAFRQLVDGYPHHLQKRIIGASVNDFKWHFVEHHIAHAASAFICSPYKRAAVMTMDGRGEKGPPGIQHQQNKE